MSVEQPASSNIQEHQRLLAALRESEILRELAELLTSSLDLNHILQVLVKRTTEVCQIERCAVWLLDEAHNMLRPATYYLSSQQLSSEMINAADYIWKHSSLPFTDPAIQRLFRENGMLFLEDLASEPSLKMVAETFLVRSILIFALVREGRPVGMLTLDEPGKTHTFSSEQIQLAQAISQQASMAIDNARLLQEAHEAAKLATERANTLDAVFHAMTEGISVVGLEGHILMRNNAAASFLGKDRFINDELHQILNVHPTYTIQGQPISGENFPVTRALRGERIRGERFVTTRADGNERILEVNIAPLFDSANKQIGVVSAFRDVTEQIRNEQRIRQALDTLLHVAEAVTGITEIKDILHSVLERALVTLNCERGTVQLYDEEHQLFTPLFSIGFSPETEQQWFEDQQVWLRTLSSQNHLFKEHLFQGHATLVSAEQCYHHPNPFDHLMILSAPILHNNKLHGIISLDRSEYPRKHPTQKTDDARHRPQKEFTLWDIAVTEGIAQLAGLAVDQALWQQEAIDARASEAAMREANILKDEFLAITAHEFRTPLTVILAQSQLVTRTLKRISDQAQEAGITKLPQVIDNLSVIVDQTHQLTNIVSTFLEVARLNRGELTLQLEGVDLALLAQDVVSRYKTLSKAHSIGCVIEPIDHAYVVHGDSARLEQIIANLVENAIKYSPQGGPIKVYLRRTTDIHNASMIEVCIEDKGIGIPKDAQSRLFERFYRAPNTEGSNARGIGLGLYIVAQLLKLQGGSIRVESSGIPGEGSRFTFTLPAIERA